MIMGEIYLTKDMIIDRGGVLLKDYINLERENLYSNPNKYYLNGIVYKFLEKDYYIERNTALLEYFDSIKNELPINLVNLIRNPESGIVVGYTSKFYKTVYDLYNFLHSSASLDERKVVVKKIIELSDKLRQYDIFFSDWDSKNFFFPNNLKMVGFDRHSRRKSSISFIESLRFDSSDCFVEILGLCVSVLIGIDLDNDFINCHKLGIDGKKGLYCL